LLLPLSLPPCFFFEVAGVASLPTCAEASIDAAPKEPAAVYLAALRSNCQWVNLRFHRFFAVFPGFSLENAFFIGFWGPADAETLDWRAFRITRADRSLPAVKSIPSAPV
jgi:hypothetical protein